MPREKVVRLVLAAAVGLALPFLPALLQAQAVGGGTDLSGHLGLASGVGAGTFAILYLAGVLTSLTPCVYPLIPITVGIFGARKANQKGRSALLSATYVAGIASTYSALGLFAALSGKAFGGALASPIVVVVLSLLLFALAASMFGAFEVDLPESLKQRLGSVRGSGYAPAFAMGLVAGVIAAPCTGPVLAGVLAYVATQRSVGLGFWMLFTYALGMGTLFFVIGAFSVKLPRSGAWMETVKSVMGVALIAAGVTLILPRLGARPELPVGTWPIAAAAGVIACVAVLAGSLSLTFHGAPAERLQKGVALLLLVGAVGLRFGWFGEPQRPRLHWIHDEATAMAQAAATGKPLLVDFWADWCEACNALDAKTFSDPRVREEVETRFVPFKVDASKATDEIERLTDKYSVQGMPVVLVFPCKGGAEKTAAPQPKQQLASASCEIPKAGPGRLVGFESADQMLERLRRVQ